MQPRRLERKAHLTPLDSREHCASAELPTHIGDHFRSRPLLNKTHNTMKGVALFGSGRFLLVVATLVGLPSTCQAFANVNVPQRVLRPSSSAPSSSTLNAKKQKKKDSSKGGGGGGFGAKKPASAGSVGTVSADKNSLEKQWDAFAGITDLEIAPRGDPDDDDYEHFVCADVFVRVGSDDDRGETGTGWYRTGKVVAADETDLNASLALQRGLILWTAVHMWPALAAGGKSAAKALQLGYQPPTMYMADETDGALDEEDGAEVVPARRVSVSGVSPKDVGFRPDFNPPGFTYKRRERAAMKKRKSAMEEIADAS